MSGVFDYWPYRAVSFCFHALFVFISTCRPSKLQDGSPALGSEGRNLVTKLYLDLAVLRRPLACGVWVYPRSYCTSMNKQKKQRLNKSLVLSVTPRPSLHSHPQWHVPRGGTTLGAGGQGHQDGSVAAPGQGPSPLPYSSPALPLPCFMSPLYNLTP